MAIDLAIKDCDVPLLCYHVYQSVYLETSPQMMCFYVRQRLSIYVFVLSILSFKRSIFCDAGPQEFGTMMYDVENCWHF